MQVHVHRYDIPVTIGGQVIDRRCACGVTLTEATVRGIARNTVPGFRTAGVVSYVPASTLAEDAIDDVFEDWHGRR